MQTHKQLTTNQVKKNYQKGMKVIIMTRISLTNHISILLQFQQLLQ